ncbi:MAG: SufD family Fe-S cluster assembly protein [Acidobacteria bacterium]|nr:SufD family Fe-S cluster assembly protein [Acidobacteriota bacterium]
MSSTATLEHLANREYKYGFVTDIETETIPKGLTEDTVRLISEKKNEPEWMLEFRLKAFRHWLTMKEPATWANFVYPRIDFQNITYYAAPKQKAKKQSLDEVDPELLKTFEKLGIPLTEQKMLANVAVDAVFDSVSVATTYKEKLKKAGVIFMPFSEALIEHPDLIKKYLGSVVPTGDNFYAALNSAVFSDGSFVFIPKGVRCPMELSTYFRINTQESGQFERTLIVAEEGAYVAYNEGCHPAGERVLTADGWRNIEGIKAGDQVYDHNGKLQKVRAAMVRNFKGEMITVRPMSRYNAFKLTPEHPVYAIKRKDVLKPRKPRNGWLPEVDTTKLLSATPAFIKADELEKGDFVLVPKLQRPESGKFNDDELELLGYYLAEGSTCFNKLNKQFVNSFAFGLAEEQLIDRTKQLIEKLSGKRAYVVKNEARNGANVQFYSSEFSDWFTLHCGKYASEKSLSGELMNVSPRQAKVLLEAYLAGDGNVCDRNGSTMVRFCTVSEKLAQQVQMLLNKLDIQAWIQVREGGEAVFSKNQPERIINRKPLYQVGYTADKKWDMVRETETHFIVPVREVVREQYDDLVFNIDVDETHSYLVKGFAVHNCTAPQFDTNQLHAAVVELVALDDAEIKYSTVQNWYAGDAEGKGGIYNFVTKRGACRGVNSKISWTQVETGSAITWKYPSVILQGDNSIGEFYSVALTNNAQIADTGTKMIHLGKNTKSTISSKGISAGKSNNSYRGLVKVMPKADGSRNYTQCDSMLIGGKCEANTFPYIEVQNSTARVEHEATTSKISEEQLFYLQQRGISQEDAISLIINGFCKEVFRELPMEYAVEATKLLGLKLEGSVG